MDSDWTVHWTKVTYDDQTASYDALVKRLAEAGFTEGEPEYLQ